MSVANSKVRRRARQERALHRLEEALERGPDVVDGKVVDKEEFVEAQIAILRGRLRSALP